MARRPLRWPLGWPYAALWVVAQAVGSKGGGADNLYGEDGDDTVNSRDSVSGNDSLDGGAGTDTKVTDATEKSIVGFP